MAGGRHRGPLQRADATTGRPARGRLAVLGLLAAGCAGPRTVPGAPIPPPPPSALAVLSLHAGELGLSPAQRERLELEERSLAAATAAARREVEDALAARQRQAQERSPSGSGGDREGWSPAPGSGSMGGPGPGGRVGMGGGHRGPEGGLGGGHGQGRAAGAGPVHHLAAQLRAIEDAEMKAYLEAEAWLPEALHERCREVVARQREQLLERHEAIRARLGIGDRAR